MRAEIAQATRENKTYIRNVERAKMIKNIQETKKRKLDEDGGKQVGEEKPVEVKRQFRQNKAKGMAQEGGRAESSEKVKRLLSKVF